MAIVSVLFLFTKRGFFLLLPCILGVTLLSIGNETFGGTYVPAREVFTSATNGTLRSTITPVFF